MCRQKRELLIFLLEQFYYFTFTISLSNCLEIAGSFRLQLYQEEIAVFIC